MIVMPLTHWPTWATMTSNGCVTARACTAPAPWRRRTVSSTEHVISWLAVIARKIYPEVLPKVEYRLTTYGQTLAPVIHTLKAWGDAHIEAQALQANLAQ